MKACKWKGLRSLSNEGERSLSGDYNYNHNQHLWENLFTHSSLISQHQSFLGTSSSNSSNLYSQLHITYQFYVPPSSIKDRYKKFPIFTSRNGYVFRKPDMQEHNNTITVYTKLRWNKPWIRQTGCSKNIIISLDELQRKKEGFNFL